MGMSLNLKQSSQCNTTAMYHVKHQSMYNNIIYLLFPNKMTSFTVDTTHRSALHSIREREHNNEIFKGLHGGKMMYNGSIAYSIPCATLLENFLWVVKIRKSKRGIDISYLYIVLFFFIFGCKCLCWLSVRLNIGTLSKRPGCGNLIDIKRLISDFVL